MIYLDHNATTPADPRVIDAMLPYFGVKFGNAASRSHGFGMQANAAVEVAREQLAGLIGASPKELVWTSGATESNNLAILGVAAATSARHIVTCAIEHKAVLDPFEHLKGRGVQVSVVPVANDGIVRVDEFLAAIRPDTAFVSLMLANNEIGTLQPVAQIAAVCRSRGIVVHTDAAQALGKIPMHVEQLGADLISMSAHKLYGPKGVGALYVRRGRPRVPIEPIVFGGGHERGLRSGTLPVPLCVGFGVAAELCRTEDLTPMRLLRDRLWTGLQSRIPGISANGSLTDRLPNNLNVAFEDVDAAALMLATREIAVSTGSACTSATLEPSHVLRAIGADPERSHASVRFGLGRGTTEAEIDATIELYATKVPELRALAKEFGA